MSEAPSVRLPESEDMSSGHSFFELINSFNLVDLNLVHDALEQDPSLLTLPNKNGMTAIQVAAYRGHKPLIKLLAEHGADIEMTTNDGRTPAALACQSGSLYAVHAFYEYGANMKTKDIYGRTLMHHAATIGAVHIIHYLHVNCGLPYDQADDEGYTVLHLSVWNNHLQCVMHLLKKKRCGNINAANRYGTTALSIAAKNANMLISRLLIQSSSENLLLTKDGNGMSPIDHARQGATVKHNELAVKMFKWTSMQLHKKSPFTISYETLIWFFVFVLPGSSLTLACIIFILVPYLLVSIPLCLVLVIVGFFAPLGNHRLPVDSGLQNPAAMGAFISGLLITLVCYFVVVWPRLWPDNWLWFMIVAVDYVAILVFFWKLEHTDPGYDLVGKLNSDGQPMTIVDVAKQDRSSQLQYSFCSTCEIVLPQKTKHCKLCGHCCNGFDHHCLWLMTCIGLRNHRLFVIFLFLLTLDNTLFVRGSVMVLKSFTHTLDPWIFLQYGIQHEKFLTFVMICNFLTGVFAMVNLLYQLSIISLGETTYFDVIGTPAFGRKRERKPITCGARLRNLKIFFTRNNNRLSTGSILV